MAELKVVIPTRGRASIGKTWKHFSKVKLTFALHRGEERAYRRVTRGHNVFVHDGNTSAEARNAVLDMVGTGGWVLFLDDDIHYFGIFVHHRSTGTNSMRKITGDEFVESIIECAAMAEFKGYHLVGIAPTSSRVMFNPGRPISQNVFIDGACMCMRVVDGIRFDTACPMKIDYDITLQYVVAGLGVIRFNTLLKDSDYDRMPGGARLYRKDKHHREACEYLLKKWPGLLEYHHSRPMELIISNKGKGK